MVLLPTCEAIALAALAAAATAAASEELTVLCRTGPELVLVLRVLLAAAGAVAAATAELACSCC
jgi:hypothetical protein